MNEIILELAALLLTGFCLVYSVRTRQELYFPLPEGTLSKLKSQHFAYLGMLISLLLSAATSVTTALLQTFQVGAGSAVRRQHGVFFLS